MANAITVGRLILLFIVIWLIYIGNVQVIAACMLLVIVVFVSDGLDGWVARKTGSTTTFGAVFDIAGDRVVENALWVVFADLKLIPVWIPLLVLTRGFVVDGLRSLALEDGMTPFGTNNMMRSPFTRWLTAGRFMRAFYGWVKAAGFVFLTGLEGYRHHAHVGTFIGALYGQTWYIVLGWFCVVAAVVLTVVRALPVLYDSVALLRGHDRRSRASSSL